MKQFARKIVLYLRESKNAEVKIMMNEQIQFRHTIKTEEELRKVVGYPSELVKKKVISYLDHNCLEFISKSPFW